MNSYFVYLAGPISDTTYGECTDWREYVKNQLFPQDIIALSPMRGRTELTHEKTITHTYEDQPLGSAKGITARDTFDVKRADLIFANLLNAKEVSIGTVLEIGMAHALHKQIVVVMEKEGNPHQHAMLKDMATYLVSDLDEAIAIVSAVLLP